MASMYGGQGAQQFGTNFLHGLQVGSNLMSTAQKMQIASQAAKDKSASMTQQTRMATATNDRVEEIANEVKGFKSQITQSEARVYGFTVNDFSAAQGLENQGTALEAMKQLMPKSVMKQFGMANTNGLNLGDASNPKQFAAMKQYAIKQMQIKDPDLSLADINEVLTDLDIEDMFIDSNTLFNNDSLIDLTRLSAATGWAMSVTPTQKDGIESQSDAEQQKYNKVMHDARVAAGVKQKKLQDDIRVKYEASTDELDVALGLKSPTSAQQKNATKYSLVSDFMVKNPDATDTDIASFVRSIDPKKPAESKLPTSKVQEYEKLVPLVGEKSAIETVWGREAGESKIPTTAITAYDNMIGMAKDYKVDFNQPEALVDYNKLPQEEQNRLKAAAKEYYKEAGEKLADPSVLARHLATIKSLNVDPANIDTSVKDAAGLGDAAFNSIKQYFTTGDGIEFKKQFTQTFNNLLMAGSKGQVNRAEVANLEKAFGGVKEANEVVFNNFQSMVTAMASKVRAYEVTSPTGAKILYGDQLTAYKEIEDMLNRISSGDTETKQTTITTNTGDVVPMTETFEGD